MATLDMHSAAARDVIRSSTNHSGHYMMSCLDETSDQSDDVIGRVEMNAEEERERNWQRTRSVDEEFSVKDGRVAAAAAPPTDATQQSKMTSCFIENNLAELLKYMSLTYGKLPSPKWKDFKGIKLKLSQKVRLNNIIWREWHMQYIKFTNPVVCQFDAPTLDRTHNKPEAVVLEGKYWKRRLESLAVEYNKWRSYGKQKLQILKHEEAMQKKLITDNIGQLDSFFALIQSYADEHENENENGGQMQNEKNDFNSDQLFTSLAQSFAFPCAREIAEARNYFSSDMIVQPGLIPLQPNLRSETMDTYDLKMDRTQESQRRSGGKSILSSLLMGTSSAFENYAAVEVDQSQSVEQFNSYPTFGGIDRGQTAERLYSSPQNTTSFTQLLNTDSTLLADMQYLTNSDSSNTMPPSFALPDFHSEMADASFGFFGYPPTAPFHGSGSQTVVPPPPLPLPTNHLRALLQGNGDHRSIQRGESGGVGRACAGSIPQLNQSSERSSPSVPSLHQAGNRNIQKLIAGERLEKARRRASTGTLPPAKKEEFVVPQKFMKLKSHSVGSGPVQETTVQSNVRRRKSSCISQAMHPTSYTASAEMGDVIQLSSSSLSRVGEGTPSPNMLLTTVYKPRQRDQTTPSTSAQRSQMSPLISYKQQFERLESEVSSRLGSMTTNQVSSSPPAHTLSGKPSSPLSVTFSLESTEGLQRDLSCDLTTTAQDEAFQQYRVRRKSSSDHDKQQHVEHRRVLHLSSEQKRRGNINSAFEKLEELVSNSGVKPNSKLSKASTLHKSANYISQLQKARIQLTNESESLRKEIDVLGDELRLIQSNLPLSGCVPSVRPKTEMMYDAYDDYIRERTQFNWKFWIFGQILRPLYETYMRGLSSTLVSNFNQAVRCWLEQHCTLTTIRPAVSNELREICKRTSIIKNPSLLPDEALRHADWPATYRQD